ncbi:MAG: hypothetical protein K2I22_01725 [Lachnospiraceae bacterium]|nr:hypothetical protein [Lachnospiraceae bacterium]
MKRVIALLAAVIVLAGSVEMTASAVLPPIICEHNYVTPKADYQYSTTSTHPVWVANKPNGEPILATCTISITWQHYKYICACGTEVGTGSEKISESHTMHH